MERDHIQFSTMIYSEKRHRRAWFSFNAKYDTKAGLWRCVVVADYVPTEEFNTLDTADTLVFMRDKFEAWQQVIA